MEAPLTSQASGTLQAREGGPGPLPATPLRESWVQGSRAQGYSQAGDVQVLAQIHEV